MGERRCRFCDHSFQPSKYQPGQLVCGNPECQRRRRAEYHRQKIAADPEYRQVCHDSARKWREQNPDYWKQYRASHPAAVEQNRKGQRVRDRRQGLRNLANNNSALDLKHAAAAVWLLGPDLQDLANNNSAPAQVWVLEVLPPRKPPASQSCKQPPPGVQAASTG